MSGIALAALMWATPSLGQELPVEPIFSLEQARIAIPKIQREVHLAIGQGTLEPHAFVERKLTMWIDHIEFFLALLPLAPL